MTTLNPDQRAKLRNDLRQCQMIAIKMGNSTLIPQDVKSFMASQLQALNTLAIAAGAFDPDPVQI